MGNKLVSLADAVDLVADGSIIGVGGVLDQMVPMALLLELVRAGSKDLHVVSVAAGLGVDLPVAARCASEVTSAIVTYEDLGTARAFRRRVEAGDVVFHEYSELTLLTRLMAAMNGISFLPTRGALGTGLAGANPDDLVLMACPFTGQAVLACRALKLDVAVVHAHAADPSGNVQLHEKHVWHDIVLAKAARRVIVTVEEIMSDEEVRENPDRTVLPAFAVDAVVHAPRGAWPTTCRGFYDGEAALLRGWVEASRNDASLDRAISGLVVSGWGDEPFR